MFFKKKNNELENWLKGRISNLEASISDNGSQLEGLKDNVSRLQSAVQKHDMAIEDLLEEWTQRQSEDREVKEQFREYEQNERRLLELFEAYQEQLWNLKRFARSGESAWAQQITLMEESLKRHLQHCGIELIHQNQTEVDYDLHEVIELVETSEPGKAGQVAQVYRCGYWYKGNVRRKAQVAAYADHGAKTGGR